jgi:hypothetical protein
MKKTHGRSKTVEHRAWCHMKGRCLNPRNPSYRWYGARGIRVCDRWLHSFETFFADMGECPPGLTLERKETNGDYTPGNCIWDTVLHQRRNMRSNVRLTFQGQTLCITEWAEVTGISAKTIRSRLKAGWPVARILTEPAVLGRNQSATPAVPASRRQRRWKRRPVA